MKALLYKTRQWVDIDTKYIFDNQYNTVDTPTGKGNRIFDGNIVRLYEDARIPRLNEFRSVYDGKFFSTEEEFKEYCAENRRKYESKEHCPDCFYCRKRKINESKTTSKEEIDGKIRETVVEEYELEPYCYYNYDGKCELLQSEKYGIVHPWKNAYFIKHPFGTLFDKFVDEADLHVEGSWRIRIDEFDFWLYNSKQSFRGTFSRVIDSQWHIALDWEKLNFPKTKVFEKAVDGIHTILRSYIEKIQYHNKIVMSSWMYRQPDGTMLDKVEIKGKTVTRPEPILLKEFQILDLLQDLRIDFDMLDCYREYECDNYDNDDKNEYMRAILEHPEMMKKFLDEIRDYTKYN